MNALDYDWRICRICKVTLTSDPDGMCSRCRKKVVKREKKIKKERDKLDQKRLS